MATRVRNPLVSLLTAFLLRLRFPYLFAIALGLFVLNLIVPDPIPFLDELMLGLLAAVLASLRTGRQSRAAPQATAQDPPEDPVHKGGTS